MGMSQHSLDLKKNLRSEMRKCRSEGKSFKSERKKYRSFIQQTSQSFRPKNSLSQRLRALRGFLLVLGGFVCGAFGYIPRTGESIKLVLDKEEEHDEYNTKDDQNQNQNQREKKKKQVFQIEARAFSEQHGIKRG
uniref:Uncharacterized protein n=1 Tax=Lactuca sativa TaxID=4236 RepID=A0A9R1VKP5_LACSA|nr:hypothetical protein LSAT_V11C500281750 [Lactuca sativa]